MSYNFPNNHFYKHVRSLKKNPYCIKKAYICSLFSELAYNYITEYEMNDAKRVHIIPSSLYEKTHREKSSGQLIDEICKEAELDYSIVENSLIVALIVSSPQFIVIAIRGTQSLYDWTVNLKCTKVKVNLSSTEYYFHRGFHDAIFFTKEKIEKHVKNTKDRIGSANTPVYITGHSLGGALSSILYLYSSEKHLFYRKDGALGFNQLGASSCYVFGCPRYIAKNLDKTISNIFHFCRIRDIVPLVPPACIGFPDYRESKKYCSIIIYEGQKSLPTQKLPGILKIFWHTKMCFKKIKSEHNIERYRETLSLKKYSDMDPKK